MAALIHPMLEAGSVVAGPLTHLISGQEGALPHDHVSGAALSERLPVSHVLAERLAAVWIPRHG
ncbi:hypothetical protein ACIBK9_47070 [Nonomuraea sp. NPDC050227]|uniref:hypothetical protein n=1 Tax=Nonomuraea sp. NPDC050227 TaxID=3364360 RepID=UPI0037A42ADD